MLASAASLVCLCDSHTSPLGVEEPVFSWSLKTERQSVVQKAYRIEVFEGDRLVWDSGRQRSDESAFVRYGGESLKSATRYTWRVRTWYQGEKTCRSAMNGFMTGILRPDDWEGAGWISYESDRVYPRGKAGKYMHHWTMEDLSLAPGAYGDYVLPRFRRELDLSARPVRATAFVCGLGQFVFTINGRQVGDHFLDPAWTAYDKEVRYVSFDILPYLEERNVLGVALGNGFFNIPNERYYKICGSYGAPRLKMLVRLEYADGSSEDVVTDGSWKAAPSPVLFSSIYKGEVYDSRLDQSGWDQPGFDDASWQDVGVTAGFNPEMLSQRADPLRVIGEITPVSSFPETRGTVYDMGRNYSGVFRLRVKGHDGQRVRVWPTESLDGGRFVQTFSGTPVYYEYVLSGEGEQSWQPQFSYYGQRWFLVETLPSEGESSLPEVLGFTGLDTSADFSSCGSFSCSNPLFNDALKLVDRALRSNSASLFTDCPHREKLGWLEQTHLMFPSIASMYDVRRIYRKILSDMAASQREDGCIPTIAPEYVRFEDGFEDTPEWGSALIIDAWYIYRQYGDDSSLKEYYPLMKRYVDYLRSRRRSDGVIAYGLNDWLTLDGRTSPGVTSHLTYVYDLAIMHNIAAMLGERDDARMYADMHKEAVDDFNSVFWNPDFRIYDNDTQADNAMALYYGVVPEERLRTVADNLLRSIMEADWSVTTGEVAHPCLLSVLSAMGSDAIVSRMHSQRRNPGYGWLVDRGATTLTEAWDGTLSQNHFANGHIVQWFYGALAGISQTEDSRAFRHLVIEPRPVDEVSWVKCSFETAYGKVVSNWERRSDGIHYHIEVPPCCDAAVRLQGKQMQLSSGAFDFVR